MSGGFPTGFDICCCTPLGPNTSTSKGTIVTANSTINSMGPWVQIGAANTANDISWIVIGIDVANSVTNAMLVNIGIGASGSVNTVINDLSCAPTANQDLSSWGSSLYSFPLQIQANNALWAQCQASTASATCCITVLGFEGSFLASEGCAGIDTYGANTANSFGTALDPGASAETKGSWVSMVTSTGKDICGLFGCIDPQGQTTGAANTQAYLIDIGIGSSGSQNTIVSNYPYQSSRYSTIVGIPDKTNIPFFPINIPAGTNIWARCQCNQTTATVRIIGLTLYGVWA
jgi:hypothetical protein